MKRIVSVLAIIALMFSFSACQKVDRTVATVNGTDVKESVYNYYLNSYLSQFSVPEGTDASEYWASEFIDGKSIEQFVCDSALRDTVMLAVSSLMAADEGITINSEADREIDKQITSTKTQYGTDETFKSMLASYGLTDSTFRALLENEYLQMKLSEKMQEDYTAEQMKVFYNNDMVNVQHILIRTVDDNMNPLSAEEAEAKKTQADDIYNQLQNGADFSELQLQYNEDSDGVEQTGYTLSKYSSYVEPFLSTALRLEVDRISEPVKSAYGYHIIKRFDHLNNDDMYVSVQSEILNGLFIRDVEKAMDEAEISYEQNIIDKINSKAFGR